ncbi:MAG: hypothetical protein Q8Q92_02510, partial [bacterium]|nr:hypothetical protein [bacterium]
KLGTVLKYGDRAASVANKVDDLTVIGKLTSKEFWSLSPTERGNLIHKARKQNTPPNYPVVDRFDRFGDRIATSIKSINLDAGTYKNLSSLKSTLKSYIDDVADFRGTTYDKYTIGENEISGRALELVVPHGGSAAQQEIINQMTQYGSSRGVRVNIIIYP